MKNLFKIILIADQVILMFLGWMVYEYCYHTQVMSVDIKEIVNREILQSSRLNMSQQQRVLRAHVFSKKIHDALLKLSHGKPIFIRQAVVIGDDDVTPRVAAEVFQK